MNVERLRMVKRQILKYPDETDMRSLHVDNCHCIFGWAQVLFSPRFLDRFWRGRFAQLPANEADLFEYLGMTYAQGRRLYHVSLWPGDLYDKHLFAKNSKEKAEVTAEAIERFIADPEFAHSVAERWWPSYQVEVVETIF